MLKLLSAAFLLAAGLGLVGAAAAEETVELPTFDSAACGSSATAADGGAACEAATDAFLDAIEDLPEDQQQQALVNAVVLVAEAAAVPARGGGGGGGSGGGGGACGASAQSSGGAISQLGARLADEDQAARVADIADAVSNCEPLDTKVIKELSASPA